MVKHIIFLYNDFERYRQQDFFNPNEVKGTDTKKYQGIFNIALLILT